MTRYVPSVSMPLSPEAAFTHMAGDGQSGCCACDLGGRGAAA